jgi:uncharacterized protein (TIGR00251 family)
MSAVQDHPRGATIALTVLPRASHTELVGEQDDALKVRLSAPPVDGAANSELVRFLTKLLGVRKADIQFLSGERSRRKVVLVIGCDAEALKARLGL